MIQLNKLFDIEYGNQFDLNKLTKCRNNYKIAFINRTSKNNGVACYVETYKNTKPYPSGLITVTLGGTLLSTFIQQNPFYTAQNIKVLKPKNNLTLNEKLFYCAAIQCNRFRYTSHGREANKTLDSLLVPSLDEIPEFVHKVNPELFLECSKPQNSTIIPTLKTTHWKQFRYDEIFEIKNGYYNKKPPINENGQGIPFIGATENQNGITSYISYECIKNYSKNGSIDANEQIESKLFPAKAITVSNNGSVGEAFYQPIPFTCSHDVNSLYLKNKAVECNVYIGLFLSAIIRADKYRWGYGRKWRPIRMPASLIKLPVTNEGSPDWQFMENYIKTLPYSSSIK